MLRRTKIIVVASGVVVALVLLTTALVLVGKPRMRRSSAGNAAAERASSQLDAVTSAILTGANPETCRAIGDAHAVDQCFAFVARARHSATLCEKISDEAQRVDCHDTIAVSLAGAKVSDTTCSAITDPEARRSCILALLGAHADDAVCAAFSGDDNVFCLDRLWFIRARAGVADACTHIASEDLRDECESKPLATPSAPPAATSSPSSSTLDTDHDGLTDVEEEKLGTDPTKADTDGDGLSDFDEVRKYHTNPLKADTDGDGFPDGVEVKSGHNPNGRG